jgi:hypothetical protein
MVQNTPKDAVQGGGVSGAGGLEKAAPNGVGESGEERIQRNRGARSLISGDGSRFYNL